MGKLSAIAWTKSTFNPWIGCTKVGPGCDFCYAAAGNMRWADGVNWGPGAPRRRTTEKYWRAPYRWNEEAPGTEFAGRRGFWPVFCASQADVFDNEVDPQWRADLFKVIRETPNLTWQLVTKRIGNARKMLPADWGNGYDNVWMISTIVNQDEADRDLGKLLEVPAPIHGISYEPALGRVDWRPWLTRTDRPDWIIVGGESLQTDESGKKFARDFPLEWAHSTIEDCVQTGGETAVFIKQLGARPLLQPSADAVPKLVRLKLTDAQAGAEPDEWPHTVRYRQFPKTPAMLGGLL